MLRARIEACDALIHVVGLSYGFEPVGRDSSEARRSYTQLEYELARELSKPVYVFVCAEGFAYDEHPPVEHEELQRAHRTRVTSGDEIFEEVESPQALAARVHALQARVDKLAEELRRARSWLGRGVVVGLVVLALLGGGLWWVTRQTGKTAARLAEVETELDQQRRYIRRVADVYTEQKTQLAELKLTDAELFDRALGVAAEREGIALAELRSGVNLFVAAVHADPKAGFLDRALADFAEQDFSGAAENAGHAADLARKKRLAAEARVRRATDDARRAREREREARTLQGRSLLAAGRAGEAVAALSQALEVSPRADMPEKWAALTVLLGDALNGWAKVAVGDAITQHRVGAIAAYRRAIEVYSRAAFPKEWAMTQHNLANALRAQAEASEDRMRARLLGEAVAACRLALEVRTREAFPQDWAWTQNNLANALSAQARASEGGTRARLLGEAVAALRLALEVRTREALPQGWAWTQNNLAFALHTQAAGAVTEQRLLLLKEAVVAMRSALQVWTARASPGRHAPRVKWIKSVERKIRKLESR